MVSPTVLTGSYLTKQTDGSFSTSLTLLSFASAGTYHVSDIQIQDNAGNFNDYQASTLASLNIATAFTLTGGTPDTTLPTLNSLTLPGTVDLSGASPVVTIGVAASDDLSGVNSVVVFLDKALSVDINGSPTDQQGWNLTKQPDGSFSTSLTLSSLANAGTYHVSDIQIQDNAGNLHDYQASTLASLNIATAFAVGVQVAGVTINGTTGNDLIDLTHTVAGQPFPTAGDDVINGGAGNDIIFGGLGNNIINGDAGVDTAGYVGFSTQYSIGFHGQTVTGQFSSDQLTNIENILFDDGRMVYDQGDAVAIAYRMYDSAFGRAPDSFGQNYWTTALQKDLSVADMASAFAGSQEFVATYGNLNNQGFIEQLYHNVLDRAGEATGVAYWTNLLNNNALNRGQVLAGFSELTEHVQKIAPVISAGIFDVNETAASVARLYDATFNRLPDGDGLLYWKNSVDHGTSLSAVADGFASSAEFQHTYGNLSNQGFVEQLYHNVLDRAGEATGVAYWTAALASGQVDRGDVLLGFSESLEHQVNTAGVIDHGIWFI